MRVTRVATAGMRGLGARAGTPIARLYGLTGGRVGSSARAASRFVMSEARAGTPVVESSSVEETTRLQNVVRDAVRRTVGAAPVPITAADADTFANTLADSVIVALGDAIGTPQQRCAPGLTPVFASGTKASECDAAARAAMSASPAAVVGIGVVGAAEARATPAPDVPPAEAARPADGQASKPAATSFVERVALFVAFGLGVSLLVAQNVSLGALIVFIWASVIIIAS